MQGLLRSFQLKNDQLETPSFHSGIETKKGPQKEDPEITIPCRHSLSTSTADERKRDWRNEKSLEKGCQQAPILSIGRVWPSRQVLII